MKIYLWTSFKEKAQEDQIGEQRMTLMQVLDSWEAFVDHVIKIDTLVDNTNTYFDSIKSISLDDFLAKFPPKDRIDDPERSFCKPTRSLAFLDEIKDYIENTSGGGQINFSSDFHFFYDLYHQFEERTNFSKHLNFSLSWNIQ